ncbi:MAG: CDP-alcohol phosphatidyltransferase family protein [Candidatus Nanopelagicales bacterium]
MNRPPNPTIADLREITQPPLVTGRAAAEHWAGSLYLRKFSPYFTRVFIKLGLSANAVTWLMIVSGFSAALMVLIPGYSGLLLPVLFTQLQMLIDCCDGEVARWNQTFSPLGTFLDKLGHYIAEGSIAIALGLKAAGYSLGSTSTLQWEYAFLGSLLAVLILFNKGMNDAVHVARAFSGLEKLPDVKGMNLSNKSLLRTVRKIVSFFPVHRIFHSIEMTIYIALLGVVGRLFDIANIFQLGLIAALIIAALSTPLHVAAIITSNKLKA